MKIIPGVKTMSLHNELANLWETGKELLGPVKTDYSLETHGKPKLIIVCESPSVKEIEEGIPTAGETGNRIRGAIRELSGIQGFLPRKQLPGKGYYITNLISYRANAGLATQGDRETIDVRISNGWRIIEVKSEIKNELGQIYNKYGDVPILFSCGKAKCLEIIVNDITSATDFKFTRWIRSKHPCKWNKNDRVLVLPREWDQMCRVRHPAIYSACSSIWEKRL